MSESQDKFQKLKQEYNYLLAKKSRLEGLGPTMPLIGTIDLFAKKGKLRLEAFLESEDVSDEYRQTIEKMSYLLGEVGGFEWDEALFGFIASEEDQEIFRILKEHGLELGDYSNVVLTIKALKAVKPRLPKIDRADMESFADDLARKMVDTLPLEITVKDKNRWKQKLKSAAIDIMIGVIGSGLYELLTYLSTYVTYFDGAENDPVLQERNATYVYIRCELVKSLSMEDKKNLECQADELMKTVKASFSSAWLEKVSHARAIEEFNCFHRAEIEKNGFRLHEKYEYFANKGVQESIFNFLVEYAHQRI